MFNAKASAAGISLFLDVDPKSETILEFIFEGVLSPKLELELNELKKRVIGLNIALVKKISRAELTHGHDAILPLGLWLLKNAILSYEGSTSYLKSENDLLCLCFSVSKKDIVKKVLANKDFELKTLIQETMASSACGSCRIPIEKFIMATRNEHGLIKGLDHSKSRFDKAGNWIKIAGLYPGPLLLKLNELKNTWMEREGIVGQFKIEFIDIEGHHLTVSIDSKVEKTVSGLLDALSDYLKSQLGVLFFLKAL